MEPSKKFTAFVEERQVATGSLEQVLPGIKPLFDRDHGTPFLVFDDETGKQVDFDLRGTLEQVLDRVREVPAQSGPGRPRLGVVAREITLLPRQWEWLEMQSGGASAVIRRLIEDARKKAPAKMRAQQAMCATGRFLSAMAGNYPGYEEATRALYRNDRKRFEEIVSDWPKDVRQYATRLSRGNYKTD